VFRPSRTWARSAASDCRPRPSPVLERVEVRVRHPGPVHRALVAGLASGEDGEPDGHEDGDDGVIQDHSLVRRSENEEGHRPVSDCHEQRRRDEQPGQRIHRHPDQLEPCQRAVARLSGRRGHAATAPATSRSVFLDETSPHRSHGHASVPGAHRSARPVGSLPRARRGTATRLPRSSERSWRPGPWALARRRRTPSRPRRAT